MKNWSIYLLVLTLISAVIGFGGFRFPGIEIARVGTVIFADLFIVSLLAKLLFDNRVKEQKPVMVKQKV
ncbi:DUF1328 domain-containing protein [Croceiramulus getboli]|nr:DUF1328 domain-containing protein [Flavobacteriaceae bacterium YJPT1-3]